MRCLLLVGSLLLILADAAWGQGRLNAELDKFGNPIGAHGLAADGEFSGKRLLLWGAGYGPEPIFVPSNPLLAMLKQKGFSVEIQQRTFDSTKLKEIDQLWLFCGQSTALTPNDVQAIEAFVRRGKGLYLVADNAPFTAEANQVGKQLFDVAVEGDYAGQKTIAVRQDLDRNDSDNGRPSGNNSSSRKSKAEILDKLPGLGATIQNSQVSHFVKDHALLTGINFIYEGITISHLTPNNQLETVLVASDGQILAGVAKDKRLQVVMDCGYTRYFPEYLNETAGTLRYAENVAAYLMGVDREKPLNKQTVAELLATSVNDEKVTRRQEAIRELADRRPAYSEIKDKVESLCRYINADQGEVARAARNQLALAFQQAPISHCLHWIAQDKEGLSDLIWSRVDDRIARADAERRKSYHDLALKVVLNQKFDTPSRLAALQLLLRLKDQASLSPLIDSLIELPRELWPTAGATLASLSGQDFGPHDGDKLADVVVSSKKWNAWRKDQ